MAAFASIAAGPGTDPPYSAERALTELRGALSLAGVVAGLDDAVLLELAARAADPVFERADVRVAAGSPPRAGQDGAVEIAFEQGLAAGSVSADGHMNFFERQLLKSVSAGQTLAIVRAPAEGCAGTTVEGQPLLARAGTAAMLALGSGAAIDAEGVVRATRDGVVLYKPGAALDVVDRHQHRGAVDLRSGHLEMQGSLSVQGDVERLLQVRASGDVEVLGAVSGGSVRAGGSVRVTGNVRGGDEARVVAGADVTLKSCEAADVTAQKTLRVQESVNSALHAEHVVITGRLRGGSAVAELSVQAKEAGTPGGTPTLLQAGEPIELPDLEQVQRAVVMQKLRRMAERGGVRDAFGSRGDARGKGGKLGRVNAALSHEELQQIADRAERRGRLQRAAFLELDLGHAGVELRIGAARLTLEQSVRGLRYRWDAETGQLRAERTTS